MDHRSKYTNKKPTQLPTTPIAEYELVNMRGMNSNRPPNTKACTSEQYAISGIDRAMYKKENRSSRNIRGCGELVMVSQNTYVGLANLRRSETVESEEEQYKPEYRVHSFDGEFCRSEE